MSTLIELFDIAKLRALFILMSEKKGYLYKLKQDIIFLNFIATNKELTSNG